jgi:hypothetical protein
MFGFQAGKGGLEAGDVGLLPLEAELGVVQGEFELSDVLSLNVLEGDALE